MRRFFVPVLQAINIVQTIVNNVRASRQTRRHNRHLRAGRESLRLSSTIVSAYLRCGKGASPLTNASA